MSRQSEMQNFIKQRQRNRLLLVSEFPIIENIMDYMADQVNQMPLSRWKMKDETGSKQTRKPAMRKRKPQKNYMKRKFKPSCRLLLLVHQAYLKKTVRQRFARPKGRTC